MKYTVRGGDTLSEILKRHNVKNYASPSTWAKVATPSGSPHLIRPGERLDLSRVLPKPAPAPKKTTTKSTAEKSTAKTTTPAQKAAEKVPTPAPRPDFHDVIGGTQEEFLAGMEPRLLQMAAGRVNPEALRMSVDALREQGKGRGFGGVQGGLGGTPLSGYGEVRRENLLGDLESQRKEMMQPWLQQQKDLFSNWYQEEMTGYEESPDTMTLQDLQRTLPHDFMGGDFQLGKRIRPGTYEDIDLRNLFGGTHTRMPTGEDLYGRMR